ncbi:MAG: ribonuclease III [Acidobacteriota bacterium]|nr:ribonuclease III [Acidobacteriota bacterium]
MTLADLEKKLGYKFKKQPWLEQALIHSSYAYEHSDQGPKDNEILEFLGDSVVGLVLADFLFTNYPGRSEGQLSKLKSILASTNSLAVLARKLRLDQLIKLGKGEEKNGGRSKKSILAGTFEALMGAIYLDSDYGTASLVLSSLIKKYFKNLPRTNFQINNFKSALQEYFYQHQLPPPVYRTVTESGPEHEKVFTIEVSSSHKILARAKGLSKKSAEQKAAQKALKKLFKNKFQTLLDEAFIIGQDENGLILKK